MGGMISGPRTALKGFVIWSVILLLLVDGVVDVVQGAIAEEDVLDELDDESIEVDNASELIYVDLETTENATNESVADVEIEDDDGELVLDDEIALDEPAHASSPRSAPGSRDRLDSALRSSPPWRISRHPDIARRFLLKTPKDKPANGSGSVSH